jgi:glycosyltransferase involved in cell wall biosynthesis
VPLRILHIVSSPHLGGAEQVCLSLGKAHLERGHDVRLLALQRGKVSEAAETMGLPLIHADLPDSLSIGKHVFRRRAMQALSDAVREFHPQLVHSHVPLTNLLCNRVMPGLRVPWIATVHGSWRQFAYASSTLTRPQLRPYLLLRHAIGDLVATRSAARLVAVADYVKRQLQSIGIADRKIVTIVNGLALPPQIVPDESARKNLGVPQDALVIGAMGYFAPVKGFDILIRAVARLLPKYPDLHVLIAGGGILGENDMQRTLEDMIAALCPGGRVCLVGTQDPNAGFLSALDVFVISSLTEGLPLSLIQAMQHGKPSVVSSAGGSIEAARPGKEGLVFQSRNIEDLAAKIETLILNKDLRQSLGRAAKARAENYLTLARCADDYERVYEDIVRQS